ncbi:lanthionine synthetase LanC family protein [Peribacillus frigoritolerans]|uniref:lanthionine synthetase LanC family protein n=1 Tax=Peribacillus frigoritolerans TaxID=450367 RepID=UPI001F4F60C1|nr:lanthionine synthetase LanC family protein [Peribacillus frigoritolerans]MCK2020679.1 protein kinase [Peribacillus frigoritolerans]
MSVTGIFVLPADVILTPAKEFSKDILEQMECEEGSYAISRPGLRSTAKMIDAATTALLKEFQTPKTIVQAVLNFSITQQCDPEEAIEGAYPLLKNMISARFLVPLGSEESKKIVSTLQPGTMFGNYEVVRVIQVLEDTELYQVQDASGRIAALKMIRPGDHLEMAGSLKREKAVLQHLKGPVFPTLLEAGMYQDREYLFLEWVSGVHAHIAAKEYRKLPFIESRRKLLSLSCNILEAYSCLHQQKVIHGDVHEKNLLVESDGSVKILDYGLARSEILNHLGEPPRGGMGEYLEPEYAKARLENLRPPKASIAGEQYQLAVLLYYLFTGSHYLKFAVEKKEMRRQIAEDHTLPFFVQSAQPWPEVEAVLAKALHKDPSERFSSVAEFLEALKQVAVSEQQDEMPNRLEARTLLLDETLREVLKRAGTDGSLFQTGITSEPTCSLNFGAAGIAYFFYRLACLQNSPALLALADQWASKAAHQAGNPNAFYSAPELIPEKVGLVSPYHTVSGVYCVQALISQAMGDMVSLQHALNDFVQVSLQPCENLDLTLGKSSTLLACSQLLDVLPDNDLIDPQPLLKLGDCTLQSIWAEIDTLPPIQQATELSFSGIAHGWAGILYATMRWCQSANRTFPSSLVDRLEELAGCAEVFGRGVRWKRKLGSRRSDDYTAGWCNGSTGFVFLWTYAYEMLNAEKYLTLAQKAAWNAWEDTERMADLCCGYTGRAYSLLNVYKYTGDKEWVYRARELANRAANVIQTYAFTKDSLYKGEIGVALLAADLSKPEMACMPFFEREKRG